MQYRKVPGTDCLVSEIGFGTGGNAGLMVRGSAAEQLRVIAEAHELGVNYFYTAPDYGDGEAEKNLGAVIRELGISPVITTKVEVREANLDDPAAHVIRSAEDSLGRLGVEGVDFLMIHNGPVLQGPPLRDDDYLTLNVDAFLSPGGVLDGLQRVREAGKARYFGFVCRGDDLEAVRALMDTGAFHLINVPYTLLNPSAGLPRCDSFDFAPDYENVIGLAGEKNAGCAVFSPLAGGTLAEMRANITQHNARSKRQRRSPEDCRRADALRRVLAPDCTLSDAAWRFSLAHPGVSTVVGGFSTSGDLRAADAARRQGELSPQETANIENLWRSNFGAGATPV